jgi:hypothetical protein
MSPMRTTCYSHLILLDLINLILFFRQSPLCKYLNSPVTSSPSGVCVCVCIYIYRVPGNFVSIFQDLIPEIIPSQKYHKHWSDSQRQRNYGCLKIKIRASCSIEKFDYVVPIFYSLFVRTPYFFIGILGVRSGDRSGQFCGPPRPIHRSRNCSFRYSVTCRLKCGVSPHAGRTSIILFRVV